jgi:hypothetical protein
MRRGHAVTNYKFSGHETFPCRYAWLPKAYRGIRDDRMLFSDEEKAMAALGVGKNMVRAMRFWVQAAGIAESAKSGGAVVTPFGDALLDPEKGMDAFLEDRKTLWLLHWQLSTQVQEPLFAWDYLLNQWPHPEITRSSVLREFSEQAKKLERKLSNVTLEQHYDTFLHTYVPTRSKKGDIQEDNLDCPLVELELILRLGDRESGNKGRREPIYAFRRDSKDDISPRLFAYCLDDFWRKRRPNESTLTFRDVAIGHGSPGQIFKLPEFDIRARLDTIQNDTDGMFHFEETAALQRVVKTRDSDAVMLFRAIFDCEDADV